MTVDGSIFMKLNLRYQNLARKIKFKIHTKRSLEDFIDLA